MNEYKGKKFIASYSGGKDSALALYRAIKLGMKPVELITTYNRDNESSWFHGIPYELLNCLSVAIGIPLSIIDTSGENYEKNFELKLQSAHKQGVETCVFGDIDIDDHLKWCTERCTAAGIEAYFPLWKENRKKLVYEFIDSGFKSIITIVDNTRMPEMFIGKILTREIVDEIEKTGADICGENGEYHTFTFDGPLFKNPVAFQTGDKILHGNHTILPIK